MERLARVGVTARSPVVLTLIYKSGDLEGIYKDITHNTVYVVE